MLTMEQMKREEEAKAAMVTAREAYGDESDAEDASRKGGWAVDRAASAVMALQKTGFLRKRWLEFCVVRARITQCCGGYTAAGQLEDQEELRARLAKQEELCRRAMAALSNCTRQLEEAVANLGQEKHAARALAIAWHATIEKALLALRQAKAGWMRVTGEGPMLAVDYFASMIEELREAKANVEQRLTGGGGGGGGGGNGGGKDTGKMQGPARLRRSAKRAAERAAEAEKASSRVFDPGGLTLRAGGEALDGVVRGGGDLVRGGDAEKEAEAAAWAWVRDLCEEEEVEEEKEPEPEVVEEPEVQEPEGAEPEAKVQAAADAEEQEIAELELEAEAEREALEAVREAEQWRRWKQARAEKVAGLAASVEEPELEEPEPEEQCCTTSDEDFEWRPSPTTSDEEPDWLESVKAAEEVELEELRERQLARREVLLSGAVEEDAGGRCVCEELDEQSLGESPDAVRDTATS